MLKREALKHLNECIIPFWKSQIDKENGGYYCYFGTDLTLDKKHFKGGIVNSRILYFFSEASVVLNDSSLLDYATHAYNYLKDAFIDKVNGGLNLSVTYDGKKHDETKLVMTQAYAIYALSHYYLATNNKEALDIAFDLFNLVETKCKDDLGYLECLNNDYSVIVDSPYRTMNTHLSIIEAYTELFIASKDLKVKEAIIYLIGLFKDKIFNKNENRLNVRFDRNWNVLTDLNSYGHNMETYWLLVTAYNAIGMKLDSYLANMVDQALIDGYRENKMIANIANGKIDESIIWWSQCETINALATIYELDPKEEYIDKIYKIWDFSMEHLVDKRNGSEWFNELDKNFKVKDDQPISWQWKACYHTGRMCLELIKKNIIRPTNKNATKESRNLLNFLGKCENKAIITGQHTQTVPQEELDHIYKLTGFKPLLTGYELLGYSNNINPNSDEVCLKEVRENQNTVEVALADKGIITFSWHWFSPIYGIGKSFYAENTSFEPKMVLKDNSKEQIAFYKDLDDMAKILEKFKNINKPILWRPFHEADGKWFWWGRSGEVIAKELYIMMYNYFVNVKKLDNLIWVWNSPNAIGYPGDEYVDIISQDIYTDKHKQTSYINEYNNIMKNTTNKKLIALAECGVIPNIDELKKNNFPWIYFMCWSKEFIMTEEYNYNKDIISMYQSEYSLKANS